MRRKVVLTLIAVPLLVGVPWLLPTRAPQLTFPGGKQFAFSIIDDTDMTALARARPVYDVLHKYGVRTTKTVWMFDSNDTSHSANRGDSLQNPEYRQFIQDLHRKGFEIALHGVRGGSSVRAEVVRGLDEFKAQFGAFPRMHVNHSLNKDNLYWGSHVFAFAPLRWAAGLRLRHEFSGSDPASAFFWGDIARERIQYVRRFTFDEINLLRVVPSFPYHLSNMPYVNFWFPTSNGDRIREFDRLLQPENLDRLQREGGVCLVYAHLGSGSFNRDGGVDPRFDARIRDLVARNGWFAPASDILDYLRRQPEWTGRPGLAEQARVDLKYLGGQLMSGM